MMWFSKKLSNPVPPLNELSTEPFEFNLIMSLYNVPLYNENPPEINSLSSTINDGVGVADGVTELLGVMDGVTDWVGDGVGEDSIVTEGVTVGVEVKVGVGVTDDVSDGVIDGVTEGVTEGVTVMVGVIIEVEVKVGVTVGVDVGVIDGVTDEDGVIEGVGVGVIGIVKVDCVVKSYLNFVLDDVLISTELKLLTKVKLLNVPSTVYCVVPLNWFGSIKILTGIDIELPVTVNKVSVNEISTVLSTLFVAVAV